MVVAPAAPLGVETSPGGALPDFVTAYGDIAAGALTYPMAPQLLEESELRTIAGALHGWEAIKDSLDPAMNLWTKQYGGGITDGALKLKLQTWFRHWVKPPSHYMVHLPRVSNGAWYRLYRTGMRIHEHIAAAATHAATLNEEALVARYSHILGHGARERYAERCEDGGFRSWWSDVLNVLKEGDWHLAVYSPQWEAFISPVQDEPATSGLIERALAEFPVMNPELYPLSTPLPGSWDLSRVIREGALVEVYGDLLDAPPFGGWGHGVAAAKKGPNRGRAISGIIHTRPGRTQAIPVAPGGARGVVLDAPNLGGLLQDIYAVTGWRAEGTSREAMSGGNDAALVQEILRISDNMGMAIEIPEDVFTAAVATSPQIIPVYGRLVSTLTHVSLDRRTAGDGTPDPFRET